MVQEFFTNKNSRNFLKMSSKSAFLDKFLGNACNEASSSHLESLSSGLGLLLMSVVTSV